MKILYLAQLVPYPLDAGPKTRMYYVLRQLARMGHEISLCAFRRPSDSEAALAHVRQYCAEMHTVVMPRAWWRDGVHFGRSLVQKRPFLVTRDDHAGMYRLVRQLARATDFGAIHADQLWMAPYALAAQAANEAALATLVLDQHNAVALIPARMVESSRQLLKRWVLQREARLMGAYEQAMCAQFDTVVWVTAEDRQVVGQAGPVIPICIAPRGAPLAAAAVVDRVTFIGGMHWPPNAAGMRWFATKVWPTVRAQVPTARLTVIGKEPPAELMKLDGVEVTGYIEDPTPYLAETAAFIVPLHAGGGMRVKILDAWGWGVPIVSTTIGAEGIAYEAGRDMLIADEALAFGQAVVQLLQAPALRTALVTEGHVTVNQNYDWEKTYASWQTIYPAA